MASAGARAAAFRGPTPRRRWPAWRVGGWLSIVPYAHRRWFLRWTLAAVAQNAYPHLRVSPLAPLAPARLDPAKRLRLHRGWAPPRRPAEGALQRATLPPAEPKPVGVLPRPDAKFAAFDRARPALLDGLLDRCRPFLAGDLTVEEIAQQCRGRPVAINGCAGGLWAFVDLHDFVHTYMRAWSGAGTDDEPLLAYIKTPFGHLAESLPKPWPFSENLLQRFTQEELPLLDALTLEPFRGGLPLKRSRFGFDYWSALTEGEKLWILFPPDYDREVLGITNRHRGGNEWMQSVYGPYLGDLPGRVEFVQRRGEVVYVPRRWWFKWVTLSDEAVSCARWFVDRVNARYVWRDSGGLLPPHETSLENRFFEPYAENAMTSADRRVDPMAFRRLLWQHWAPLLNPDRTLPDEAFWPEGFVPEMDEKVYEDAMSSPYRLHAPN